MVPKAISRGYQLVCYWLEALDAHSLHSPFIFNFYTQIINGASGGVELLPLQRLTKALHRDNRQIEVLDFGAGNQKYRTRKISRIAQTSHNQKAAHLLFRLARYYQPKNILELGTSLGLSTISLALGAPDAQITTIEGCPNLSETATRHFQKLGLSKITQYTGPIDENLDHLIPANRSLDVVFIDANHRYQPTVKYFEHCLKEIHNNSVMVLDDIHWSAEMSRAWEYIKAHPRVRLSIDLFQLGLVFFEEKLEKHHYILEF